MATVSEHYAGVLGGVYSWMFGGFEAGLARNRELFARLGIKPQGSGRAVDLGAGCGFQSLPLAELGFEVTAVDLDRGLLDELERHRGGLPVRTVAGDLMQFDAGNDGPVELAVCMTDTLLHLDSESDVALLLRKLASTLEPGGRFIATFRDLSQPLEELDRFIPVRSDESTIMTCFLEYEPRHVRVHDLVYSKANGAWQLSKSFYRKLRLSPERFRELLDAAGLTIESLTTASGLVTAIAKKDARKRGSEPDF